MTETEMILINSLKESELREKHLSEQLNAVTNRLDVLTSNYQALLQRFETLTSQLKNLREDMEK